MKDTTTTDHNHCVVRFAPSPTGFLHIGGVRTALFNYLYARKRGGSFLLRIEDTDRERSQQKYEDEIIQSLSWLGLMWDNELVRQSERLEVYQRYAEMLIKADLAYRVDGTTKAVSFKIPKKQIVFYDMVHGKMEFNSATFDDFIIMKSDGVPTWLFGCVIDDIAMKITHVIRGDDHLSNTPRQILLYEALNCAIPTFAHLPLIFGSDGSPLSKRHGATALTAYREQGYLPEGLLNYLALLGWGPAKNKEYFPLSDLIDEFSIKRVNKTNGIFDAAKLNYINALHIKDMNENDYIERGIAYFKQYHHSLFMRTEQQFLQILSIFRSRIKNFRELIEFADYLFEEVVTYDTKAVDAYLSEKRCGEYIDALYSFFSENTILDNSAALEASIRLIAQDLQIKAAELIHALRVALTGKAISPNIFEIIPLIGRETVLARLQEVHALLSTN